MYGKYFASTFTGSMFGAGPDVFAVWGYVIANAVESQVELNPNLLAAIIGTTPDRIRMAIDFLCSPDPQSRTKTEEGRRLVREGEFAYRVPNLLAYRSIRNEEERREYNRLKKAEQRERDRVKDSVIDKSALSAQAEAEAKAETETRNTTHTLALLFAHADHARAYLEIRGASKSPVSLDAMLGTLHLPISGGAAYSWEIIGQALLELQSNGSPITANAIRAFCRKLAQPEPTNGHKPTRTERGREALARTLTRHGFSPNGQPADDQPPSRPLPRALPNQRTDRPDG